MSTERETPFSDVTRLRALEVMGDTDTWTGGDWQRTCILLASAIIAAAGDFDRLPPQQTFDFDGDRSLCQEGF